MRSLDFYKASRDLKHGLYFELPTENKHCNGKLKDIMARLRYIALKQLMMTWNTKIQSALLKLVEL